MYKQILPPAVKEHAIVLKNLALNEPTTVADPLNKIFDWPIDTHSDAKSEWLKYN